MMEEVEYINDPASRKEIKKGYIFCYGNDLKAVNTSVPRYSSGPGPDVLDVIELSAGQGLVDDRLRDPSLTNRRKCTELFASNFGAAKAST